MSDHLEHGPEISVDAAPIVATILACVLAQEIAVMPDRLKVDDKSPAGTLEALRQKLLREAKSTPTDGATHDLEAKGMTESITVIEWVCDCVRDQI
jgi:hypothetical protein